MRRVLPMVLAAYLAACGGGSDIGTPNPNPPPPPPATPVPNALIIQAGNNQEAVPGEAVTTVPTVQVKDQTGAPMAGVAVRFAVDAGGGTVQGETATTGADGTAHPATWLLGSLPGENRLKATSGTLTPVQFIAQGRYLIATNQLTGTVTLPAGSRVAPGTLRIQSGLADVPVGSDGSYTGVVEPNVLTLSFAVAPNGNPILFGWIDTQKKNLSVRTTAEVLTYFDVNGYLQINNDARRIIRDYLAAGADLHELEAAITSALGSDAALVTLETPAVVAARKTVVARLRSAAARLRIGGTPSRLVVDPAATPKSGVIVDQTGFNSVIVTNERRRHLNWFLDRISYVPKGSRDPVASVNRGALMKLGATSAVTSVIGTGIDMMFGNLPYTPVISEPIRLDRFPVDARSTTYRVTVVGPGHLNSNASLTTEQHDAMILAGLETLVMEFVLPFIDQALSADNLRRDALGQAELDGIIHRFFDLAPQGLYEAVEAGDMTAGFRECMKLLFDTGMGQGLLKDITMFAVKKWGKLSPDVVAEKFKRASKILTVLEIAANAIAAAQVAVDVWNSSEGESWDVTITGSQVNLDPGETTISQIDTKLFRAKLLDATPEELPAIGYRWITSGRLGKLCAAFQGGEGTGCDTTLESSQDVVTFLPDPNREGTDDIRVEVFLKEGNKKTPVGEGTAKITTYAIKVEISPTTKNLKSGEFATFSATLDPRFTPEGLITYRFSTPGVLGQIGLNLTSIESGTPSATYSAKIEVAGTEGLTVEVFQTKDGVRRRLGSATALITVEKVKPTVVQGRFFTEVHNTPNNRVCVAAYIAFPLVAGAHHYEMHAYNFNDTLFWGTEINLAIFLVSYPTPWGTCDVKGGISGSTGTEFIYALSGGNGPASGASASEAQLAARFAGMKIDVTVKYTP